MWGAAGVWKHVRAQGEDVEIGEIGEIGEEIRDIMR